MSSPDHVLVVGASVAGLRVGQALRTAGYDGRVTLLGDEPHVPYDKPPLSKELLVAHGAAEAVPLLPPDQLDALHLDLRLGVRAKALDPARRVVTTDAGEEVAYDVLVIATGVTPRTLPGTERIGGVHTLRNLEDAQSLRALLAPGRRAVVVGAGFIGSEFAAAARTHGVNVIMVEAQPEPLAAVLGVEVGAQLRKLQEANGVSVLTNGAVDGLLGTDRVTGVLLADGTTLAADMVVVGIGASPAVSWLDGSGLPLDNGVTCDEAMRVVDFPGIYAAGDIASWKHPLYDEPVRIEHWTNAGDHAALIAADILGRPRPSVTLPYVWSDQYGHRIQIVGRTSLGPHVSVRGEAAAGDLCALYSDDAGKLVAAVVMNDPRLMMKARKAILRGETLTDFEQSVMAPS